MLTVLATENAEAQNLARTVGRMGLNPKPRRLFVIDGSKALRAAINAVFGERHLAQPCRLAREICSAPAVRRLISGAVTWRRPYSPMSTSERHSIIGRSGPQPVSLAAPAFCRDCCRALIHTAARVHGKGDPQRIAHQRSGLGDTASQLERFDSNP